MKRKFWNKFLGICLGFGIPLVFLGYLPTFLSKGSGKYLLFSIIHKETQYSCDIEELKLSWFGPQKAKKIKILGEGDETEVFTADSVQIDGSLIRLLLYRKPKGLKLYGWSLKINEPQTINHSSFLSHFDPGIFLSYLKKSDVLSEHGSIFMKTLSGSSLSVSGFYLEKTSEKIILKSVASEGDLSGKVFIESTLSPKISIAAEFSSVPTAFLRLFIASPFWDNLLSHEEIFNLTASATHTHDGKILMTVVSQGNQIQTKLQGHIHNLTFYIIEGSSSFIKLQPKIATALCSSLLPLSGNITSQYIHAYISKAKIPLNIFEWPLIEISSEATLPEVFLFPENPNSSIQFRDTQINIKKVSAFTDIRYSASPIFGNASPSHLNGTVRIHNKKHYAEFRLQQAMLPHTYLRALFPKSLLVDPTLESPYYSLEVRGLYKNSLLQAQAHLDNPSLKLSCSASGSPQALHFEGEGTYILMDKWKNHLSPLFSQINLSFSGKSHIAQKHLFFPKFSGKISAGENELSLHAKFGNSSEPIKAETTSLLIHGKLASLPLNLFSEKLAPLQLNKANFSIHSDGAKSIKKGNLQALIDNPKDDSLPSIRIHIPEILFSTSDSEFTDFKNLKIQGNGEITSLPLDVISKIYGKDAIISTYFGSTGDLTFSGQYTPKEKEHLTLFSTLTSEALSGEFNLIMDSSMMLSPKTEGTLQWEISPNRYASFFENTSSLPTCMLHRTATIRLDIAKLACAKTYSGLSCLTLLGSGLLEGTLSAHPLIFYDYVSKETFIIDNFAGSIRANNLDTNLEYDLKGTCLAPGSQTVKISSEFSLKGEVNHLFTPSKREFSQTTEWKYIPSSFITGIVPISPTVKAKISSLAGPRIDVSITNHFVQGKGSINILVDSENLQAQIPLIFTEKAILLQDNLKANLHINEAINKAFLQEFNPLISGNAYSQYPVTLEVDKHNFYLPIRPYSFEKFHIQSASLDIGKISIANTKTMHALFQFLDIEEQKQFVESWFTPIFFSVQKGSIICSRFDALIDNRIRLALWGKTDIPNDKIFMTLGIDPEVIKKYFHNTSLRTKDFFLIKIRGSISSPEVDWSSAYARIALLKSYNLAAPFNNLADKLFSSLGSTTPPQTTSPLPWEKTSPPQAEKHQNKP
ncbi:hypothetical protein [Chlamydia sp. 17-3921]|uniref:hypothetical protein n=1 Tax=Chlamydia sp. 17-3921 TaxID=2675798 RepID=UPI001917C6F4|nr:hypothetical protein [Chlamydia sp. 17-3921]